ncbi:60 kDa lysophospholipase-like [Pungitius pungitius]|uniref:60 kDa lysophospholipase-like n=1 Tax=Pungitius pungitius TaxID=134920 RepID=UPI002E0EBCFE
MADVNPPRNICRNILKPAQVGASPSEVKVLVIYTGGTIGMTLNNGVLAPAPNALVEGLRKMSMLHDEVYASEINLNEDNTLVLPLTEDNKRIVYTVLEYSPLLDSSNISIEDWGKIGKDIEENYDHFDGFVILHGTDTMAYTASALSFMCEHLCKPIILTGSQVPIYRTRSDGTDNLLGALLFAGRPDIPEVCLYFCNKLFRGNRVTKVNAASFDAFSSPNLDPLAVADVKISVNKDTVRRADHTAKFHVSTELNTNVVLLKLFPGITTAIGEEQRGKNAALGGTGADGPRGRDVFPQLHVLLPVGEEVSDPLAGGVGYVQLGEFVLQQRRDDGVEGRAEVQKQDPGVTAFLQQPMKGVVLETYGSGNAPDNRPDLLAALKKATDNEVIIMNCTQCLKGTVSASYATGKARCVAPQSILTHFHCIF